MSYSRKTQKRVEKVKSALKSLLVNIENLLIGGMSIAKARPITFISCTIQNLP